jgi:hypothetical protein
VALLQRLPAVVVPALESASRGLRINGWLQRRHPGACFAPTNFALAYEAASVFKENPVSAGAAIRLHVDQSLDDIVSEQKTQKTCRRRLSEDFAVETQMDKDSN